MLFKIVGMQLDHAWQQHVATPVEFGMVGIALADVGNDVLVECQRAAEVAIGGDDMGIFYARHAGNRGAEGDENNEDRSKSIAISGALNLVCKILACNVRTIFAQAQLVRLCRAVGWANEHRPLFYRVLQLVNACEQPSVAVRRDGFFQKNHRACFLPRQQNFEYQHELTTRQAC